MEEAELDPEIAALLAGTPSSSSSDVESSISIEDIDKMPSAVNSFDMSLSSSTTTHVGNGGGIHEVNLSLKEFAPLEKLKNDASSGVYDDPKYYKTALTNENQSAQRVHQILSKYLTCQDPKDRAVYRQQIVTCYWELLRGMAPKMADLSLPMPKRMLMRFGVLLPSLFKAEQKDFFSRIIYENKTGEPILYVDEWFKEIASGRMKNSMTDEKKTPQRNLSPEQAASAEQARLMQLQSKNSGKLQSSENVLNIKENERSMLEVELKGRIESLCQHSPIMGMEPHTQGLSEGQRKLFSEITDILHRLSKNDKELSKALAEFQEAKGVYDTVQNKIADAGPVVQIDTSAINTEFDTIRQMAKMTIGRRGNQFPMPPAPCPGGRSRRAGGSRTARHR